MYCWPTAGLMTLMSFSFDRLAYWSKAIASMMSTSPFTRALACACTSRSARFHSTRSTYTFLPPAEPEAGSLRGTDFVFFR